MIVILMGPTGAGKTVVGRALAHELGWTFHEGDDFHPAENVARMSRGVPLTDGDRWPWLDEIHRVIERHARAGESAVIACSALKQAYRDRLVRGIPDARFVYLRATRALLEERLAQRTGHFMKGEMIASQLADLEEPEHALVVDAAWPPERIVAEIAKGLGLRAEG